MRTGRNMASLTGHTAMVSVLKFSQDSRTAVTGGADFAVKIWNLDTSTCTTTLLGHTGEIECLQFDSDIIVSGSADCTIRVWSRETNECTAVLKRHTDSVTCLQFDSKQLVTGSLDGTLCIWQQNDDGRYEFTRSLLNFAKVYCLQMR